jgi:hypothetical protein
MRIGLITTLNTNIGDDFIREGIKLLLHAVYQAHKIEFISINKHQPMSVYPSWHPVHMANFMKYLPRASSRASNLIKQFAPKIKLSRFDTCELIVQCGAPVLWPGCHHCEWADPLWHQVVGRLSQYIRILNLAAGSCYPWEQQPSHITDPADGEYLRAILSYCKLSTTRDVLAQHLYASLGVEVPLIPCSAFLVAKSYGRNIQNKGNKKGIVLINFMSRGGHYDWDQGIDSSAWHNTVRELINRLRRHHTLAFLCHNDVENHLSHELDPTIPRLYPKNPQEYFALVSEAKVALCNRMHASVGLAGLGIPSVAVGTDTRLLMVQAIGLPSFYVKEVDADILEESLEHLLATFPKEQERLLVLQTETWNQYLQYIAEAVL